MSAQLPTQWTISGVPVTVKRSLRRRTVALQVRDGAVTIHAPVHVPVAFLEDFLDSRREWVEHHLMRYAARPSAACRTGRQEYTDGAPFLFLGELLTLRLVWSDKTPLRVENDLFLPVEIPEQALEEWVRAACLPPYTALLRYYAQVLGAGDRLGTVRVSKTTTRWGSCSSRGDIRLHWKLSRAPLEVLHYVALHEAAHLLEMNHSPRYWAHVARVMPGWQMHRRWLKENGQTL
ncbi:M48 family metallopeptidase [Deinococcus marmoris]|nr:SprT family zinc-dependent metalloprotease [Deinococcus marmoris]